MAGGATLIEQPESSQLRLDTVSNRGRAAVIVRGEVDAVTAPQLGAVIDTIGEDVQVIELDLGEVTFFDSTGLGVLVAAIRRLERVDGHLELRDVPETIIRLLEITDLLRFVTVINQKA